MDILTDILTTAGLRKRILNQRSLYEPWSLNFPCSQSIGFHVITQGTAYLWQNDINEPIVLNKGDIAFMTRGIKHQISTHNDRKLLNIDNSIINIENVSKEPILTLISGAYQLWHDPIHQLFYDLPSWKIINSNSINYSDSLHNCLQLISNEIENKSLGSESIISSILDIMLNIILRKILTNEENKVWGKAFNEPIILKVLQLIHSETSKEWSVESLAKSVGLSRAGFALKFKQTLGDTPLNYITTLRISKSTNLLINTDYNIEKIANLVGYKDAFSFSNLLKK